MENLEELTKEQLEEILTQETTKLQELEVKAKAAEEMPIKIVEFLKSSIV